MSTPDRDDLTIGEQPSEKFERRPLSLLERRRLAALSPRIVACLRLVHNFALTEDIIDFDLAPEPRAETQLYLDVFGNFTPGAATRQDWSRLAGAHVPIIEALESFPSPKFDINDYEKDRDGTLAALQLGFLKAKLRADFVYCQSRAGVNIPNLPLIKETQGIDPMLIGSERLQAQRKTVAALFEKLEFGEFSAENIGRYRQERQIQDPEEVVNLTRFHADSFFEAENAFLGNGNIFRSNINPKYDIKPVKKDEYWVCYANGSRKGFLLQINFHDRHQGKWTHGKVEAMAAHELGGHFFQMANWLDAIQKGKLIEPLGVTAVHDPEQVVSEGIAQTLHHFVPAIGQSLGDSRTGLSDEARFEIEYEALRQMAYNNLHISTSQQKVRLEDAETYIHRFCPAEMRSEVRKQMIDRKRHPVKKSYLYSYGIGALLMKWAAHSLNREGKREFFRLVNSQPLTPDQVITIVNSMVLDSPTNKYKSPGEPVVFSDYVQGPRSAAA